MPALLFEIGCEELPASACKQAERRIRELCPTLFGRAPDELFVTPRRLAFLIGDLPAETDAEWVQGPPESLRDKAAAGFARRHGVAVNELEARDGFLGVVRAGEAMRDVLPARLAELVRAIPFSKSMRWPGTNVRFARPVRWLCAKLDQQTLEVDVDGIPSGGFSYGHRFTSGRIEIPGAEAYAETLRNADVEPDAERRLSQITKKLPKGWSDPSDVLGEVVYLVESVRVQEGTFDERFLELPERVVVTTMQSHQRYFPLGGNRFAFVANGGDPDVVRAGNERVLESRLADASFTFERDVAVGIDALAQRLGSITFFTGAGSFAEKTERLVQLVGRLGGGDASREAARLAKADQAAELVREFPDLEGHIGAEYARLAGYPEAVCAAIDEHYLPDSAGGPLPQTEAGKILAAADRIDTLNVAFELGHKPTGSRDPYGLRRAAIGLCRLATEGGLTIPRAMLRDDVRDFVEERFESMLDVPVEFVRAARASELANLDGVAWVARVLHSTDEGQLERIHTVFTRAQNIVSKANEQLPELNSDLFSDDAERDVARVLDQINVEDRNAVLTEVEKLAEPLERFFQDVLVMADDKDVRANRLRLLRDVRDLIESNLGDLSQIPL